MTTTAGHQPQQDATSHAPAWDFHADLPATDALPYYDDEIDRPGMRAKVERELAAEMKRGGSQPQTVSEARLPPPLELFTTRSDLKQHLDQIGNGVRPLASVLDTSRYMLNDPTEANDEVAAWEQSIRSAEAQLMHSEARLTNLELLKKFGANDWRLHNFQEEAFARSFDAATADVQNTTAGLNRARKAAQTEAGQELSRLSKRWAELLNRSLSVELANIVAKDEIKELELRRDSLRKRLESFQ